MDSDFLNLFEDLALKNRATDQFIEDRLSLCKNKNGHALLKSLKIPYLVMDIPTFDWRAMLQEAKNLESRSVPHRSDNSQGWNSLCLHGIDAQKTLSCDRYGYLNEKQAPYQWTWASEKASVTTSYLKTLVSQDYFSEIYRVRFMYLQPGGFIKFHRDREEGNQSLGPLNIAINMPEKCYWLFKKWGRVPFSAGMGMAVDVSNEHGVWNFSEETRVHIIVHGIYGEEYYRAIRRSVEKSLKKRLSDPAKTRQVSGSPVSGTPAQGKEENFSMVCLLWLQNHEIKNPELLRITSTITEHFSRLRANKRIDFETGVRLTDLLSKAYEMGKTWAIVVTPGTLLKGGFFETVRDFLSKTSPDIFMFAHLMDHKERWFGIHPQCFIVNLSLWNQLDRPALIKKVTEKISVLKVIRSSENVHDNYTPTYLMPGHGMTKENPKIMGWHWIHKALESGLRVENISPEIRQKKLFLYPEQSQESLLARLGTDNLTKDRTLMEKNAGGILSGISKGFSFGQAGKSDRQVHSDHSPNNVSKRADQLSDHQEKVLDYLSVESTGLMRKMFIFNTENVRNTYVEYNMKKIDAFVGLPAGFFDLHTLYRHGFHEGTQLVYFDINQKILDFKQKLLELWDGTDYPGFVKGILRKSPENFSDSLLSILPEEGERHWQAELKLWGGDIRFSNHLTKVKALPRQFIKMNLIDDFSPLIKVMEEMKSRHIALWYSNCFNYTPGLASKSWKYEEIKQQGVAFLNHLLRLAEKNNLEITIYGEDVLKASTGFFGKNIRDIFG